MTGASARCCSESADRATRVARLLPHFTKLPTRTKKAIFSVILLVSNIDTHVTVFQTRSVCVNW